MDVFVVTQLTCHLWILGTLSSIKHGCIKDIIMEIWIQHQSRSPVHSSRSCSVAHEENKARLPEYKNPQTFQRSASLWSSLSWLDKVGRDTRKYCFSFTAWAGGGETWVTDQTQISARIQSYLTLILIKNITHSSFNPVAVLNLLNYIWPDELTAD